MPTVIFDADSTLLRIESQEVLAGLALEGRPDREATLQELDMIQDLGMRCIIGFDESLKRRLAMFQACRGHVSSTVEALMGQVSPSAIRHASWFKANRDNIHVVSGGFEDYITPVLTAKLGLRRDHVHGNRFVYDDRGNISGFDETRTLSQPLGKVQYVRELRLPRPIIHVGDGMTDAELRTHGVVDEFCAFTETVPLREAVGAVADMVAPDFGHVIRHITANYGEPGLAA